MIQRLFFSFFFFINGFANTLLEESITYPSYSLDQTQLQDLEMVLIGASRCLNLPVSSDSSSFFQNNQKITLTDERNNPIAMLRDIQTFSKENQCYVVGEVQEIAKPKHFDFNSLRLLSIYPKKDTKKQIGFFTTDPLTKAHIENLLSHIKEHGMQDKNLHIFTQKTLHPNDHFRLRSYQKLKNHYPQIFFHLLPKIFDAKDAFSRANLAKNLNLDSLLVEKDMLKTYKNLSLKEPLFVPFTCIQNTVENFSDVEQELQHFHKKAKGLCLYFVGLSGSGKSTLVQYLQQKLLEQGETRKIVILDGDVIRKYLANELGFSKKDRSINVRRIGYIASLIVEQGGICLCANIAPFEEDRLANRALISKKGKYIEVFVETPLEVCEKRDVKGLYKAARLGKIKEFTGISSPFEKPSLAEIRIDGSKEMDSSLQQLLEVFLN